METLNNDAKMLESVFRFESFYKKHKWKLFIVGGAIVALIAANGVRNYLKEANVATATSAYEKLQKNPEDATAKATLKKVSPELYDFYSLSLAIKNEDKTLMQSLTSSSDELIAGMAKYYINLFDGKAQESKYIGDFSIIIEAYNALKNKDYEDAKFKLDGISESSPVNALAKQLRHLMVKAK